MLFDNAFLIYVVVACDDAFIVACVVVAVAGFVVVVVVVVVNFGILVTILRLWPLSGRRHSISPNIFKPVCQWRWQDFHLNNNIIVISSIAKGLNVKQYVSAI